MRKIILLFITSSWWLGSMAQGNFSINAGTTVNSRNGAFIVLNNSNLNSNGTLQQAIGDGTVKFIGNSSSNISGTGLLQIDKLQLALNPGSSILLQRNVKVESQVIFDGGMLNLNNAELNLGNTGLLMSEDENSRAFSFGTGYIRAEGFLNIPESVNLGNLGAEISSRRDMGFTVIKRGHIVQSNVNGTNPSILRYYDIEPTNNLSLKATLKYYYFDAELNNLSESSLEQWKSKNPNEWDLVGADQSSTITNYVLRNNISKFSRWTLSGNIESALLNTIVSRSSIPEPFDPGFSVNAWPNPSAGEFRISVTSTDSKLPVMLRVFSATGQLIEQMPVMESGAIRKIGQQYKAGVYLVELVQGNNKKVLRLVKQ